MFKLLIIEDENSICTSLSFALEDNYKIFTSRNSREAMEVLHRESVHIVLLDLRLGNEDGLEILRRIKGTYKEIVVIIMTAYGTIESSVKAMTEGAFYYITKPINIEELNLLLLKCEEYIELNTKIKNLSNQINDNSMYGKYNIIGKSKKILGVFDVIDRVKDIDINILVTGESGTGKDLVARAIHYNGKRKDKPFNVINCSAIPDNLLESELFGYKKGAFTGAVEDKKGIIECSDGGTLFLDEIGDMDMILQTKLLRVIQEKEIRPIGDSRSKNVDVRFIAATNKDLKEEIKRNRFRQDLYYRLNVIDIQLPALRERREDIATLIEHFIKKFNNKMSKSVKGITSSALDILENYCYHGNVRELQNIIERAIVLNEGQYIDLEDLPKEVLVKENNIHGDSDIIPIYVGEDMKTIEKKVIEHTLIRYEGNRKRTAEVLNIGERTLRYKIKEYELYLKSIKK